MTAQGIHRLTARAVALPLANVDTDQIIPARFLKGVTRAGLGAGLFADWRYQADGTPVADFPLNQPEHEGAAVLVAGDNFGCGSSREHAAWALLDYGFRAVVSTHFADIFRANALGNGLLPIELERAAYDRLLQACAAPDVTVTIDVEAGTVTLPDGSSATFPLDPFARHCLVHGVDRLGFLLAMEPDIATYERTHARGPRTVEVSA
jgi:3-isopropylmalate/(R)-2-methylmalate dehydratase small subunit